MLVTIEAPNYSRAVLRMDAIPWVNHMVAGLIIVPKTEGVYKAARITIGTVIQNIVVCWAPD